MPAIDLPLESLKTYKSKIKCPIDFKDYWQKQIISVDNFLLRYELKPIKTKNKNILLYDLIFTALDGSKIYAKYVRPNHQNVIKTVLQFHDYKESSKSWFHLSRYAGMNFAVVAMECRGQGGRSEDLSSSRGTTVAGHVIKGVGGTIDEMYYRNIYLDAYQLTKIIEELPGCDAFNLMTYGIGQGASIAVVTAALNQRIKKCCVRDLFLSDFYRVWEMDLDVEFYEGLRYYFKWFDPMHEKVDKLFETLSYIDVVNFAPWLTCELLVGSSLLNKTCPPSTQFAFLNQLKISVKHIIFPKHGHELNNTFENEALSFMGAD